MEVFAKKMNKKNHRACQENNQTTREKAIFPLLLG